MLFFAKWSPVIATSCNTTDGRSGVCSGTAGCDLTQNDLIALSQTSPGQVHPSNCWGFHSGCCVLKSTSTPPTSGGSNLCCPLGYSQSIWTCPFTHSANECCRRLGFGKYDLKPMVSCSEITLNTCRFDKTGTNDCSNCENSGGVWTAIGCISTSSQGFIEDLLPFAIAIAGGIAFVLILFGSLQVMLSAGNPEKLNAGKELVSSAIIGLLLIIFSIFILQLIGVQILRIPGFK